MKRKLTQKTGAASLRLPNDVTRTRLTKLAAQHSLRTQPQPLAYRAEHVAGLQADVFADDGGDGVADDGGDGHAAGEKDNEIGRAHV
mgnify:CR=1 FL=1